MHKQIHSNMYSMDIDMSLYLWNKLHIDLVDTFDMVDYELMNKDLLKYKQYQQQKLMKMMK